MNATRRTTLAMLGLAGTSVVGSETFSMPTDGHPQTCCSGYDKERYARAFEQLANELRKENVEIETLELSAKMAANELQDTHELILRFRYLQEKT